MAEDLSHLWLELCNRANLQNLRTFKPRNMSSVSQLFLAGLAGVFMTVVAMYLWTFIGFWYQKPMLEPPGFNLMLGTERSLKPGMDCYFIIVVTKLCLLDVSYCIRRYNVI